MLRTLCILFLLLIVTSNIFCQKNSSFEADIKFSLHLLNIKAYDEAKIYLNEIEPLYKELNQKDSINFLLGKTYYLDKKLNLSTEAFDLVSNQIDALYVNAKLYEAFGFSYGKQYNEAIETLSKLVPNEDLLNQLTYTQLAGNYLLSNKLDAFKNTVDKFSNIHLPLQRTNSRLIDYEKKISGFKKRSPVIAGALSAIIPGSGKIYAGKTGEGVSALLQHIIFGFMLRESYKKHGAESIQFGIFGTVFSTLYISNIWSSTFAVKIYRNEYYESLHESIMLDLHIPLRAILK